MTSGSRVLVQVVRPSEYEYEGVVVDVGRVTLAPAESQPPGRKRPGAHLDTGRATPCPTTRPWLAVALQPAASPAHNLAHPCCAAQRPCCAAQLCIGVSPLTVTAYHLV